MQREVVQHDVQAYSFVLSPMTMQPGSQCLVQLRSMAHILGGVVEFSVDVVNEYRLTCNI